MSSVVAEVHGYFFEGSGWSRSVGECFWGQRRQVSLTLEAPTDDVLDVIIDAGPEYDLAGALLGLFFA